MTSLVPNQRARIAIPRWSVLLALAIAAAAFVFISASSIGDNLVYYWTPTDLQQAGQKAFGATIRLGGMVAPGSIRKTATSSVEFDVFDSGGTVHVKTRGVPPQMFRENIGVVVEGTMTRDGYFDGERLLVSHGNEYKAPDGNHPVNARELMKTAEDLAE